MMDVKLHDRGSRAMRLLSNQPPWGKPCSWVWPVVANTWSLGYLRLEWLESKSVQNGVPASFPGTADYSLASWFDARHAVPDRHEDMQYLQDLQLHTRSLVFGYIWVSRYCRTAVAAMSRVKGRSRYTPALTMSRQGE